jgi:hypothetical protein
MQVEIEPEPSEEVRRAIVAALAEIGGSGSHESARRRSDLDPPELCEAS